ncbi:MAG: hypothetical protein RH946_19520 [Rhodospirillales bacterium]
MTLRIAAIIEDPGAANGMVGVNDALTLRGAEIDIYATGAAQAYAANIGLATLDLDDLAVPLGADALLVGTSENPDSPVFAVTHAARKAGIPCFGFIDGPANAAHRFRGRTDTPLTHAPDFLLVSDPAAAAAYAKLGFDADKITVVGHPNMDRVRARAVELSSEGRPKVRARLFPNLDPTRPLIVFLAETSDGLDPAEFKRSDAYILTGRGGSDGRTEICLEETLDALPAAAPDAALVLRLHPKNDADAFKPYADEIAAISIGGDPLEVVFAADLVIGMTSVLLFEAAVMSRPALSVTPRPDEAAWLSSIALGLTPQVCSADTLRASIAEAMKGRMPGSGDIDALVPTGAAARMADAILHRLAD